MFQESKSLVGKSSVILGVVIPSLSVGAFAGTMPPNLKYDVSCSIELSYSDGSTTLTKDSGSVELYSRPQSTINFGPYTLNAVVSMEGQDDVEPAFNILLYKDSNPVASQVNFIDVGGLDFENREVGNPITFHGRNFLNFQYQTQNISRVDYTCALSKGQ